MLAGRAEAQCRLECLLEALRGATAGVTPCTQAPVFAAARALMGPLLRLAAAFAGHPPAQLLLLKLAGDCVEAHVSYLQACTLPPPISIFVQHAGMLSREHVLRVMGLVQQCELNFSRRFANGATRQVHHKH